MRSSHGTSTGTGNGFARWRDAHDKSRQRVLTPTRGQSLA